jgi:uncharacterized protein YqgC (DUF456 family)
VTAGQIALAVLAWFIHLLFAVAGVAAALTVLVGLPGAWMVIGAAILIELIDGLWLPGSGGAAVSFGWWPIGIAVALASVGELAELLAGALGARRAGSSRTGAVGAILGGLVGAVVGIPVPPPVLGALVCSILGTFVGAVLGELAADAQTRVGDTVRPATGATIGRILGTLAKLPLAVAVWALLVSAGLFHLVR